MGNPPINSYKIPSETFHFLFYSHFLSYSHLWTANKRFLLPFSRIQAVHRRVHIFITARSLISYTGGHKSSHKRFLDLRVGLFLVVFIGQQIFLAYIYSRHSHHISINKWRLSGFYSPGYVLLLMGYVPIVVLEILILDGKEIP